MKVILKRDWFGPNQNLYRKTTPGGTTIIPDQFRKVLPRDAKIADEGQVATADTVAERLQQRDRELGRDADPRAAADVLNDTGGASDIEQKRIEQLGGGNQTAAAEQAGEVSGEGTKEVVSRDTSAPATKRQRRT